MDPVICSKNWPGRHDHCYSSGINFMIVTDYFMIVLKALSIRQNSCLVLLIRPKPVIGYITGPIGEPNAIILNGHSIALPGPSSYLSTHKSVYQP